MTLSLRALALGLVAALTLPACDSGGATGSVTATGTVLNTFDRPVDGATLTFTGGTGGPTSVTTTATGTFLVQVPSGAYTLTVSHPNYTSASASATVREGALTTPRLAGPGALVTSLVNALTGEGIPNSAILCAYRRTDGSYLAPPAYDFSVTTSATGAVSVTGTPFGRMQCTAATPFGAQTFTVDIGQTGTTTAPPVPATPLPATGEFRVVLSWGTSPRDLDSHVTGPNGSGGRFHVYYSNEAEAGTTLDLDDTSGEGPETITIDANSGMYRYSIHNYSDQSATGSQGIAGSPTTVRLFGSTGLIKTYTAPAATAGNTWRVFELTVTGTTFTIGDAAGVGLGYVTATSSGDAGTFLTGGPGEAPMPKGIEL